MSATPSEPYRLALANGPESPRQLARGSLSSRLYAHVDGAFRSKREAWDWRHWRVFYGSKLISACHGSEYQNGLARRK